MTEVAALQMNVDTSSVLRAANDLDRFSTAATRAGSASGLQSGSIAKLVSIVQSMDAKLGSLVSTLDKLERGTRSAAASNDNMAASATKAASALAASDAHVIAYTQHLAAAAAAQRNFNAHIDAYNTHLQTLPSRQAQSDAHVEAYRRSLETLPPALDRVTRASNDNAGAMRANTGNIAAQFQDIGVTAAMGMNPLIIALQQGTQLSAVFAQSGGGALATIRAAFASIFSPVALLTIALVAGAAALIQWAMSADKTSSASDRAAAGLKTYTKEMGYTQQEVDKLNGVTVGLGDTMEAVFQVGWKRIAAMFGITTDQLSNKWSDFTAWLGTAARNAVAGVYAAFTGMQNVIPRLLDNIKSGRKESLFELVGGSFADQYREAQKFMDDVGKQAGKNARERQDKMAKDMYNKPAARTGRKEYGFSDLLGDADKIRNDLTTASMQIGLYGEALARVTYEHDLLNKASEHGLKLSPAQRSAISGIAAELAKLAEANRLATFREDTKQQFMQQWQGLKDASAQIGVYGRDLIALRYEQEALNRAVAAHITLTDNDRQVISDAAQALADKDYANILAQSRADNARSHAEQMRQLDVERGSLGLTGEALIAYRYEQDLINTALQAGVAFKDLDIEKTRRQAEAYATARYAIDQQAQAIADAREVTKGFFADTINGAREGMNAFAALADAAVNALNRIIDKLMDKALDGFLDSMFSGGSGGLFGSLFGGSSLKSASIPGAGSADYSTPIKFNALGGVYGAQRFANGGAFTNSIVSTPTLFRFANGAALGEMGEAGPEAIMPLKRGPNGALGVQMHGGGSKSAEIQINQNYNMAGAIMPDAIRAIVQQGSEAAVNEAKRQLQAWLQEIDIDGTVTT